MDSKSIQLHQSLCGIESDIGRIGNIGAEHNGVEASIKLKNVDLLAEGIGHKQFIADPIDGDGHRQPGRRHWNVERRRARLSRRRLRR